MKIGYMIGEPGVGKSTLMRAATEHLPYYQVRKPFAMRLMELPDGKQAVELGERRANFSGSDALSMSVLPKVIFWLQQQEVDIVVGEGDRLSTSKFFEAAREAGEFGLVFLDCHRILLNARRMMRSGALGATQDEKWLRGRATKVRNLVAANDTTYIDSGANLDRQLEQLAEVVGFADLLSWRMA